MNSSKAQDSTGAGAAPDSQPFPCRVLPEHLLRLESKTSHFHLSFFSLLLLFKIIIVVFQGRRYGPWSCGNVGRPESLGLSPRALMSLEALAHQPQVVTAPGLMFQPLGLQNPVCVCFRPSAFREEDQHLAPIMCGRSSRQQDPQSSSHRWIRKELFLPLYSTQPLLTVVASATSHGRDCAYRV